MTVVAAARGPNSTSTHTAPAESVRSGGASSRPFATTRVTGTPMMGAPVESRASKISGTPARRPTTPRCPLPATQPVPVGDGRRVRPGRLVATGTGRDAAAGSVMNSTVVCPASIVPSVASTVSERVIGADPARTRNEAMPRTSVTATASGPALTVPAAPPLPRSTTRTPGTGCTPRRSATATIASLPASAVTWDCSGTTTATAAAGGAVEGCAAAAGRDVAAGPAAWLRRHVAIRVRITESAPSAARSMRSRAVGVKETQLRPIKSAISRCESAPPLSRRMRSVLRSGSEV